MHDVAGYCRCCCCIVAVDISSEKSACCIGWIDCCIVFDWRRICIAAFAVCSCAICAWRSATCDETLSPTARSDSAATRVREW